RFRSLLDFFFSSRRRHTRWPRDWSSDVCSSDLPTGHHVGVTVRMLNALFSEFDAMVEAHGLEKIKTIGDAYMVAGGLPEPRPDQERKSVVQGKTGTAGVARVREHRMKRSATNGI